MWGWGKAEAMKRYSAYHKHNEDHAWEYRLSLLGKKDSLKNFKPVEDICGLERASGGSVGDRLARQQDQEERNQVGNSGSGPCDRQESQDNNREDQPGPRAIWGTIHVTPRATESGRSENGEATHILRGWYWPAEITSWQHC